MKRKFKIMNHQIEQLKEEITSKDHDLVKEHFEHHKVQKEIDGLKNDLTRIRKQIQSSEQIINNQCVHRPDTAPADSQRPGLSCAQCCCPLRPHLSMHS